MAYYRVVATIEAGGSLSGGARAAAAMAILSRAPRAYQRNERKPRRLYIEMVWLRPNGCMPWRVMICRACRIEGVVIPAKAAAAWRLASEAYYRPRQRPHALAHRHS